MNTSGGRNFFFLSGQGILFPTTYIEVEYISSSLTAVLACTLLYLYLS